MANKDITYWFRMGKIGVAYGSAIWLSFRKVEKFFLKNLVWSFQSGNKILIGIDLIMGGGDANNISQRLLNLFHRKGFFTWDKLIAAWQGPFPIWKDSSHMGMSGDLVQQWEQVKCCMRNCGSCHMFNDDVLIWNNKYKMEYVSVKDIYAILIGHKYDQFLHCFPVIYWKTGCPQKNHPFLMVSVPKKNLTWDNLQKRNWIGSGYCYTCKSADENNFHIFFQCHISQQLWRGLVAYFGFPYIAHASIIEVFFGWSRQNASWRLVILLALQFIWKWRNYSIFQGRMDPFSIVYDNIVSFHNSIPAKSAQSIKANQSDRPLEHMVYPRAFFRWGSSK